MVIDTHTHAIPQTFIRYVEQNPGAFESRIETGEKCIVLHRKGLRPTSLEQGFYDIETRLADMDARGIDIDWMAVPPPIFYYWLSSTDDALTASRILNDGLAEMVAQKPDRLRALAHVPLQDVAASCQELERVVKQYGFPGVQIGTSMEGHYFDEPEYLPFFKKCEELGLIIVFHPYSTKPSPPLNSYYLVNFIGNPLDTTTCIARMLFGGVMQQCVGLKLIFVHAGGFMPYQRGRFEHGHRCRSESKVVIGYTDIALSLDSVYYDIITHSDAALEFLIKSHGAHHIVLGTDYPFDMQEPRPVQRVNAVPGLSDAERENIFYRNAKLLLEKQKA